MKNKKIYKAIACVSVWLAVVFACVGLACFSSKVNAGVIIEKNYTAASEQYSISSSKAIQLSDVKYIGFSQDTQSGSSSTSICQFYTDLRNQTTIGQSTYFGAIYANAYDGTPEESGSMRLGFQIYIRSGDAPANFPASTNRKYTDANIVYYNNTYYIVFDAAYLLSDYITANAQNNNNVSLYAISNAGTIFLNDTYQIASCENIYDLQQGDVAIMYISDVSGFNSENYVSEITMNWGYIDDTDNTVYAAYSPTINVMKGLGDLEIWLNIPTDAGGTVYDSVILNQQALLSLITDGASSANANIYAIYVWLLTDRIQWGLLNFNTAGLPASAQSMNYFTSYTTKYDYINNNTGSMTCRLSISNNFNFITIKNQPVFSVNTINNTLRQGGLLPAWALYNWARGTASGFVSGQQAGAAPYQPGNTGYNEIFQAGYDAGLTAQPTAAWYEAAFAAVDSFLNIHIFPSITFGELFGIPFVITVVYFIIRMFRGGGGNG